MMRDTKRVSVPMVAAASGLVYGAVAVVAIPTLSFLFLTTADSSAFAGGTTATEQVMLFAVLSPLLCAVLGGACGVVMACVFNMLIEEKRRPAIAVERRVPLREASGLGDAA